MFYALSRFRYTRVMFALLIATVVATGTYAVAAGNTFVTEPQVGGGNATITGFDVSSVLFDLNDTDPDKLDAVTFTTDADADEVLIELETLTGRSGGISCEFVVVKTSWSCDLRGDSTTATELITFHVFASGQG